MKDLFTTMKDCIDERDEEQLFPQHNILTIMDGHIWCSLLTSLIRHLHHHPVYIEKKDMVLVIHFLVCLYINLSYLSRKIYRISSGRLSA